MEGTFVSTVINHLRKGGEKKGRELSSGCTGKLTLDKARSFKSISESMSTSTQATKKLKNNGSVFCFSPGATH